MKRVGSTSASQLSSRNSLRFHVELIWWYACHSIHLIFVKVFPVFPILEFRIHIKAFIYRLNCNNLRDHRSPWNFIYAVNIVSIPLARLINYISSHITIIYVHINRITTLHNVIFYFLDSNIIVNVYTCGLLQLSQRGWWFVIINTDGSFTQNWLAYHASNISLIQQCSMIACTISYIQDVIFGFYISDLHWREGP